MGEASGTDLRTLSLALAVLYRHADVVEFPQRALEAVRLLVSTDHTAFNDITMERAVGVSDPPDDLHDALVPVFAEFAHQHPRVPMRPDDNGRALALSDFFTVSQLHRTDLYQLVYRPLGVEDQMSIIAPGSGERVVSLAFNRSRRCFGDESRRRLDLFLPHFAQAFENAKAVQRLQNEAGRSGNGDEATRQGVVRLSRAGVVRHSSARARALFDHFLPERGRRDALPRVVAAWVRRETAAAGPASVRRMEVPRGSRRLTMRLIDERAAGGWLLILEERVPQPRLPHLPPRVREVLDLLLEGLSEKEVAARIGVKQATVHDYVKDLYRRLDVSSRAELMARWVRRSDGVG